MTELELHINCYTNNEFRKIVTFDILMHGLRVFQSANIIENISILKKQLFDNTTKRETYIDYIDELAIDYIKIIICFENYMKAILLQKGYCVHSIKKISGSNLHTLQKTQPIEIDKIQLHVKQDKISKTTLSLNILLNEEKYQNVFKIDPALIQVLEDIRLLRNQLHLFTSKSITIDQKVISKINLIIKYRNEIMLPKLKELDYAGKMK